MITNANRSSNVKTGLVTVGEFQHGLVGVGRRGGCGVRNEN